MAAYTVTLSVFPEGTGTVTGAGVYEEGTSFTINAIPANGKMFDRWEVYYSGSWMDFGVPQEFTWQMPPQDLELRAVFVDCVPRKVRRSVDDAPPVIPEEPTEPEDTRPVLFHDDCNSTEGWIQMYPQDSYGSLESDGSCIYGQQELDIDRYCADGLYIEECEIGDIDFEAEFQVKVGPIQAGERFEIGLALAPEEPSSDQENIIGVMIKTDLMWDADAESLVIIVAGSFYRELVEMNISADITVKIVKTGNKAELYIDNALIADYESTDIGTLDVAYVCFSLHRESEMIDESTFMIPAIYDIKVFGIALDEEGVT